MHVTNFLEFSWSSYAYLVCDQCDDCIGPSDFVEYGD